MIEPLTTNGVRKVLIDAGIDKPGIKLVQLVAELVDTCEETKFWELLFLQETISEAARKASGLPESEAVAVFKQSLFKRAH